MSTNTETAASEDLREALRPFDAAVFNDNGDVTVSAGHISLSDWLGLAKAVRAYDAALASTAGAGPGTTAHQLRDALAPHASQDGTWFSFGLSDLDALSKRLFAGAGDWVTVSTDPFRCPECGCHSYARVSERKADGSFGDGPLVRCVECKAVFQSPAVPASARSGAGDGNWEEWFAKQIAFSESFRECAARMGVDHPYARGRTSAFQEMQERFLAGTKVVTGELEGYLLRQMEWSRRVFGENLNAIGITRHIEKECAEIRDNPADLSEWCDVITLALDGFWRHGGEPSSLIDVLNKNQERNIARKWNVSKDPNVPSEHDRSGEASPPAPAGHGVEIRERIAAVIRKALVENWSDAVNARDWDEDVLLTGCRRVGGGKGYEKPEEAAQNLALDAAYAVLSALSQGGGAGRSERAVEIRELSEKATEGEWSIWIEPIPTAEDAIRELTLQVEQTKPRGNHLFLLNASGKCPATTGCGPCAQANAELICKLVNAWRSGELVHRSEIAGRSEKGEGEPLERVRHVKRGTEYEVLGEAEAQVSYDRIGAAHRVGRPLWDENRLTVYRCVETGKLWCRFTDEFRDGRFVPAAPAQSPTPSPDTTGAKHG